MRMFRASTTGVDFGIELMKAPFLKFMSWRPLKTVSWTSSKTLLREDDILITYVAVLNLLS